MATCTVAEMYKFLTLIGWMDLVKLPTIRNYWRTGTLFSIPFACNVMSRDRFEIKLKFINFADNQSTNAEERLNKIPNIIDIFIQNNQRLFILGE